MSKKFIILTILLTPAFCLAAPQVTSFSVYPSTVNSGHSANLSWTIEGGTGNSLYFFCPEGIKIFRPDQTLFPCNMRVSASPYVSDTVGLTFVNVSGAAKTLQVRLYPKDTNNIDYDAGARDIYLTIYTAPQPITDFTSSVRDGTSGLGIDLSWTTNYVDGVNLQFECSDTVKVYKMGETTPLACGQPAFSTAQPGNSTASFNFTNSSPSNVSLRVTVMPQITGNYYDATHGLSLNLNIPGKTIEPAATINSFTASKTKISSGDSVTFSWEAPTASGVNFQFTCTNALSIMSSTTSVSCNTMAFSQSLGASSSIEFAIVNNSSTYQNLSVYLLPRNKDGTYNGANSKKIDITVGLANPVVTSSQTIQSQTQIQTQPQIQASASGIFTSNLSSGSSGNEVEALQRFLAKDPAVYPEGLITGFYGSLTQAAVQRFQEKYGIAKSGDPGYGCVGPRTREKLNSLQQ
jgi:hypothetical protein